MKKACASVLVSTLLASSGMVFAANGPTPACGHYGTVTIEVYNKDLDSDDCSSENSVGKYCIYDTGFSGENGPGDFTGVPCDDKDFSTIEKNTNESYALSKASQRMKVSHYLYTKGGPDQQTLYFSYKKGQLSNNCAQVFGPDVVCDLTQTGNAKHITYLYTIHKR